MMDDKFYIKRCIELARKAIGETYPNPLVGSVIVHNGVIIGEGYHHKAGEAHAEINAINSVKDAQLLPHSTIYVSLEPCSHYGKTPPCALKLKEIGFKRVVIGTLDHHEKVNGKGKQILEDAGIRVTQGILEDECRKLNSRFFTFHQKNRPYIILKWAQSADGFMDKDFKPFQISNRIANQYTHQMRADEHAILVGTQTALKDNPSLTVRNSSGENPHRILIDFDLKVPRHFNIYNDQAPTLVFNSVKNEADGNVVFIKTDRKNFIQNLIKKLHEHQIMSLIVEGGSKTLQHFIDAGYWDEAVVIENKNLLLKNGTSAPKFNSSIVDLKHFRDNTITLYQNHGGF